MYDLLILSSEQKKPIKLNFENIVVAQLNQTPNKKHKYYFDIWPYINNVRGILYKIYTKDGLGKFECGDELFDFGNDDNSGMPYSLFDGYKVNDTDSISLRPEYDKDFKIIINKLLEKSPINTLLFLCRGQCNDYETILGKLSKEEFFDKLDKGKIFTNICYIIG